MHAHCPARYRNYDGFPRHKYPSSVQEIETQACSIQDGDPKQTILLFLYASACNLIPSCPFYTNRLYVLLIKNVNATSLSYTCLYL